MFNTEIPQTSRVTVDEMEGFQFRLVFVDARVCDNIKQ